MDFFKFTEKFCNNQACAEYFCSLRWEDGIFCPFCGSEKIYVFNKDRAWKFKCAKKECRKKFSYTSTTLFCNAKIPLQKWFFLIYQIATNRKSITAVTLGKQIGVGTQQAWGMLLKLRQVFKQDPNLRLSGTVEIDECFIAKNHQWRKFGEIKTRKMPILGMLERSTKKIIILVMNDRKRTTIHDIIERYIEPGSTIYTDGMMSYVLLRDKYDHHSVNHRNHEFVRGEVHTNGVENVWRNLKMATRNAHQGTTQKYLQSYCDEFVYKMNNRHLTPMEMFNDILKKSATCRNSVEGLKIQKHKELTKKSVSLQ